MWLGSNMLECWKWVLRLAQAYSATSLGGLNEVFLLEYGRQLEAYLPARAAVWVLPARTLGTAEPWG